MMWSQIDKTYTDEWKEKTQTITFKLYPDFI